MEKGLNRVPTCATRRTGAKPQLKPSNQVRELPSINVPQNRAPAAGAAEGFDAERHGLRG